MGHAYTTLFTITVGFIHVYQTLFRGYLGWISR